MTLNLHLSDHGWRRGPKKLFNALRLLPIEMMLNLFKKEKKQKIKKL